MNNFGINDNLVREVIDFVENGQLMAAQTVASFDFPVRLISDFEQAKKYAWEGEESNSPLTWVDLREEEMSEVMAARYRRDDFDSIDNELGKMVDKFHLIVRKKISQDYSDLLDDIASDLFNSAYSRAVLGKTDGLYEKLFAVYRAGGWPCGWDGNYPNGSLIAYFAENKS